MIADALQYYVEPGVMTDPGEYRHLLDGLPQDIPSLCRIVQGLVLHLHWAERYGVHLPEERRQEANLRRVSRQLRLIAALDGSPLTVARPLEKRIIGTCRDCSVFMCSILRHQGVPARARCGFGTYFTAGVCEDHWTCEYWNSDEARWVTVDAQIDQFQRDAVNITFDTADVPEGRFLPAGRAWQMCRSGQADAKAFGIFDMWGLWFIAGNLVRDILSLNKIELLPWDGWGLMPESGQQAFSGEYLECLDRLSELTLAGDEAFTDIRALVQEDERLHAPCGWEA